MKHKKKGKDFNIVIHHKNLEPISTEMENQKNILSSLHQYLSVS